MKSIRRNSRILFLLAVCALVLNGATIKGATKADNTRPDAASVLVGPCGLPGAMGPTSVDDDFTNRSVTTGIANVRPDGVTTASGWRL